MSLRRWASVRCGRTWSAPQRLPEGILGPIKNKPIQLADGTIVSGSSTENDGWRLHFELSHDGGRSWVVTGPLHDPKAIGAIQPTILQHRDGRLQAIGRTQQNKMFTTESSDGGWRWTPLALTDIPNPNSGIDAVTLRDGRHLLVYNHTVREDPGKGRGILHVAISNDGKQWHAMNILEEEPTGSHSGFSYPAVIQTSDGLVHITYTWKRQRIRHIVLDPNSPRIETQPIVDGRWPASVK
ncbi:MAG: exo-alpha-sialidase [Gemmatimonadetes bacterium]|nr:exo-alpha-sialidase [Gemmatimonadota bacterium]